MKYEIKKNEKSFDKKKGDEEYGIVFSISSTNCFIRFYLL